jgi:deazaflavin-dependent oxidoreductase (nitroreductase family)
MADSAPDRSNDFNTKIVDEFRANEGRVGDPFAGTPMILIHHIGAKSGIERVTPLAYAPQGDGRYAIVASNGGSLTHPDWYYNLKANPRIGVEVGTETFTVLTEELEGTARDELWPRLVAAWPSLGAFETKAARRIPLLLLTREDRPADDESEERHNVHVTPPAAWQRQVKPVDIVARR